jgi:acyl dehydratase
MNLEKVAGTTYGPVARHVSAERVAEFVAVTGDDPDRWEGHAPPGFAAALLFAVAPRFLADPRVIPFTGVLVHVEQTFSWYGPLTIGLPVSVTGRVERVRRRGDRYFVTFTADVVTDDDEKVVEAVATFLMGEAVELSAVPEIAEPAVGDRGTNDGSVPVVVPAPGTTLGPVARSASRLDLVRYAAATGDFNPIHFDHDAARAAGLPGIVVHGLLMAAWALQVAAGISGMIDPLTTARIRFRHPLPVGRPAAVAGSVGAVAADGGEAEVSLVVSAGNEQLVTAACTVRVEE